MFSQAVDERLSAWVSHREALDNTDDPLNHLCEFWKNAPFLPYNRNIDPYNQKDWPTPWEIIVDNKYDDFTKALMMAWTLKYTKKFQHSKIEIKTLVNDQKKCYYNIVCVDDQWVLNFDDSGPVGSKNIPDSFYLENLIELGSSR